MSWAFEPGPVVPATHSLPESRNSWYVLYGRSERIENSEPSTPDDPIHWNLFTSNRTADILASCAMPMFGFAARMVSPSGSATL